MKRIHDIYRPTEERKNDWREVERMLTDDELKEQTKRCMNCGQPFCHAYGCPLGNLIARLRRLRRARPLQRLTRRRRIRRIVKPRHNLDMAKASWPRWNFQQRLS